METILFYGYMGCFGIAFLIFLYILYRNAMAFLANREGVELKVLFSILLIPLIIGILLWLSHYLIYKEQIPIPQFLLGLALFFILDTLMDIKKELKLIREHLSKKD